MRLMKQYGEGSRAEICITWESAQGSHVFVAENIGGEVRFLDPQTGNMDVSSYFERVVDGQTLIMRLDDAEPTELVSRYCLEM